MKPQPLLFLFLFLASSFLFTRPKAQAVNQGDSLALVDLYNSTNGPSWTRHQNWLTTEPVGNWSGVTVTGTRVTGLYLHDNLLSGTLPASFTNLRKLVTFDAGFNQLNGSLPADIGNLDSIQTFTVGVNDLTGYIPASIGKLGNLENVDFSSNQLNGPIPASMGKLAKLQDIEFAYNRLDGSIPASLGNLSHLLILALNNNKLSGSIPTLLGKLTALSDLNVSYNLLTGSLPASIVTLPALNDLEAHHNQLTDGANLSGVQYSLPNLNLSIGFNRFTFNTLQFVAGHVPHASYTPQASVGISQHGNQLAVSAGGTLRRNTYTWYRAVDGSVDTTITGDSTFRPAVPGSYYATITNSIATGITLTTGTVTYVMPPLLAGNAPLQLSVYPNPARSRITINGITGPGLWHLTITDISGTVWFTSTIASQASVQENVSRLKAGNYTLRVMNGSQTASVGFMKE